LFIGPVFTREAAATPRNWRLYFVRALYVAALFALVATAWLILFGSQPVRTLSDMARFGAAAFSLIAPVQLAIAMGFSALLCAAAVAQEKDRRTFELLLLTRMTNSELVLGKLLASMLIVLVLILAALPLLMLLVLLGGVSHEQVARVFGVTLTAALAAGTIGSTVALWREKTFQSLAVTALALVLWLLAGEALASGVFGGAVLGLSARQAAEAVSPLRAIIAAARPAAGDAVAFSDWPALGDAVRLFMIFAAGLVVVVNAAAIALVRVWNPTRELRAAGDDERDAAAAVPGADAARASVHAAPGRVREVWDNPILWREIRTWAYGKKVLVVKLAYLAVFAACTASAVAAVRNPDPLAAEAAVAPAAAAILPLAVLGLVLVNALAVTSITNERDAKALDLLLVTDLTPKEIIFGKLGGIAFNAKEMILLPAMLCLVAWWFDQLSGENAAFLLAGVAVMNAFVAMLGVHAGMTYANSRAAVAASLGTLLFLLLGVAVCMRLMVATQQDFDKQLPSFLALIVGGGVGLYVALGLRNPSPAIKLMAGVAPFATFFLITSFLKGDYGAAAAVLVVTYGFATAAMLIPALSEFDVATGRTTARDL
jgi:ABC-type transport system involved in multi-copper enzyme maturation permease subunit